MYILYMMHNHVITKSSSSTCQSMCQCSVRGLFPGTLWYTYIVYMYILYMRHNIDACTCTTHVTCTCTVYMYMCIQVHVHCKTCDQAIFCTWQKYCHFTHAAKNMYMYMYSVVHNNMFFKNSICLNVANIYCDKALFSSYNNILYASILCIMYKMYMLCQRLLHILHNIFTLSKDNTTQVRNKVLLRAGSQYNVR